MEHLGSDARKRLRAEKGVPLGRLEEPNGDEQLDQSDFMTTQVAEIMRFRRALQSDSEDIITFRDAADVWVSQGLAEQFRIDYEKGRYGAPARA